MSKYLTYFIIGIAGIFLGAWWPQSELSILRKENETLQKELSSRKKGSIIPEMARMMTMSDTMPMPSKPEKKKVERIRKTPTPAPNIAIDEPVQIAMDIEDSLSKEEEFAMEMSNAFENADSAEAALDTMADLWRTRRDMARAALADNLGLSDAELNDFDEAMATMNDDLEDRFVNLADRFQEIAADGEPAPEDAFRMAHEFTGVFVDTYDSLDNTLPYGWREDTGKPLDLTAFIDPYVFKPMLEIDDEWSE